MDEAGMCRLRSLPKAAQLGNDEATMRQALLGPAAAEIDLWREFRLHPTEEAAAEDLQQRRLPLGWAACRAQGGEVYYHCSATGASQWAHPSDVRRDSIQEMSQLLSHLEGAADSDSDSPSAQQVSKSAQPSTDVQQHSIFDATSRHVDLPLPLTFISGIAGSVQREDLNRRAFALHGLLTSAEAAAYITSAEVSGGFHGSDVQHEFPETMRNNSRLIHFSKPLSEALWQRLVPHLMHKDVFLVQPMGFGAEGRWKPVGVNPCFRISRYAPHEHFASHRDGMYVNDDGECSIYSLVLYLNDDFKGGELQLERPTPLVFQPRQGTAVLFPHDMPHAGCKLLSGIKYIMRSELMFRCVERSPPPRVLAFIEDVLWQQMAALYSHVGDLALEGDPSKTTEAYQQALGIQIDHQGTEVVSLAASELPLPAVVIAHSLSSLMACEVLALLPVSIGWQEASNMGRCWRSQFQRRWPNSCELVEDAPSGLDAELKDWFGLYRRSFLMERDMPMCTVFLGEMIHARLQGRRPMAAVKARANHALSGAGWDRSLKQRVGWSVGKASARMSWIREGEVDWTVLPELFSHSFRSLEISPSEHSVLIPALPGVWTKSVRTRMTNILARRFEVSRVHIVPAPLCALLSHGLSTGTVVWACSVGTCAVFCYRKATEVATSEPFNFSTSTSHELVALLNRMAQFLDPTDDYDVLRNIIFSVHLDQWPSSVMIEVEKMLQASEGVLRDSVILSYLSQDGDDVLDVLKGADALAASPQLLSAYEVVPTDVHCWEWRQQLDDGKWHKLPDYIAGVLEGSLRRGESFASVRLTRYSRACFLANLDDFTASISRNSLVYYDQDAGPSWKLTRFLRGRPSSEPDLRKPDDLEVQRKEAEEVQAIAGADVLNVRTLAGKLVLSIIKSDAADFLVRDLIEDLGVKLIMPPQQLSLLSGAQPLEMNAALRPLVAGEGSLELCMIVDTSKAALRHDRRQFEESIPEDVRGEGHRHELLIQEALNKLRPEQVKKLA